MRTSLLIAAILAAVVPFACYADEQPSVLVETVVPIQGSLPQVLSIYGSAVPRLDANRSISVQAQGSVAQFSVAAGEHVEEGDELLVFQVNEAAISAIEQARSAVKLANSEQERLSHLLEQHLATKDQVSQADKSASDAQAALDALLAVGGGKHRFAVKAPFAGIVMAVTVSQGDQLTAGATLLTLVRDAGFIVTGGIEPADAEKIKIGQPAVLTPLQGGAALRGKVSRVDRAVNPKSHLIDVDISAASPLVPGAAYRGDVTVGEAKGWIVPHGAVQLNPGGFHIFQIDGTKAKLISVTVSGENGNSVAVDGPLNAKQPVAVAGSYQLTDGAAVRTDKPESAKP